MSEPLLAGGPAGAENIYLQELPASLSSVLSATAGQAFETNPTTLLYQWATREEVSDRVGSRVVPAAEARERIAREKLELMVGDEGIREAALEDLIERKYQERRRQDVIARGPEGFLPGAAQFGTGLAVSLIDPLNVASAFIPVVGEARVAQMLARAGTSTLARASVRGAVGATEGFVGAAVLEPLVYGLAQDLQKDYTMADSLLNLAFGTVLGGGLHVGIGAIRDHVNAGGAIETAPAKGELPELIASMSPEQRADIGRAALAQAIEGRAVDVEALVKSVRDVIDAENTPGFLRTAEQLVALNKTVRTPEVEAGIRVESTPGFLRSAEDVMLARAFEKRDWEAIRELAGRSNEPEARVRPDDAKASEEAKTTLAMEPEAKTSSGEPSKESELQNKAMTEELRVLNDEAKTQGIEDVEAAFVEFDERIKETETVSKAMRALAACQLRKP